MRYVGCNTPGRTLWNRPSWADWKLWNEVDYLSLLNKFFFFFFFKMSKVLVQLQYLLKETGIKSMLSGLLIGYLGRV